MSHGSHVGSHVRENLLREAAKHESWLTQKREAAKYESWLTFKREAAKMSHGSQLREKLPNMSHGSHEREKAAKYESCRHTTHMVWRVRRA